MTMPDKAVVRLKTDLPALKMRPFSNCVDSLRAARARRLAERGTLER